MSLGSETQSEKRKRKQSGRDEMLGEKRNDAGDMGVVDDEDEDDAGDFDRAHVLTFSSVASTHNTTVNEMEEHTGEEDTNEKEEKGGGEDTGETKRKRGKGKLE